MNKICLNAAIGLTLALAFPPSQDAHAGIVKVNVTGQVTNWEGGLGAQFSVGDALSMSYTFDTQSVDEILNLDTVGEYSFLSFEGVLGTYQFTAGYSRGLTYPDSTPYGDQFFVLGGHMVGADVAGAKVVVGWLDFRDLDATFLNEDFLPLVGPDLSFFELRGFSLGFDTPNGDRIWVRAALNSTSTEFLGNNTVPEPSSLAVASVLGILGLSIRRATRKPLMTRRM